MSTDLVRLDNPTTTIQRATLEPNTLEEAMQFSKIVADSDLAPKDYRSKPANVLVAIQFGKELGVPPMQALQGIAVINGRPSVWGDLMWALVTTHPDFEDAIEEVTETHAKCTLKRRNRSPVTVTFTMDDARRAGLSGKQGPWTQYPKRQMQWRARTFAARDLFPDAIKGMVSVEEAADYTNTTIESTIPATIEPPNTPAKISAEQVNQFVSACKASSHQTPEVRAYMKETLGVSKSLDIPVSRFEEAMTWAKTKKEEPKTEVSPDEKICRELFSIIGYDLMRQAEAIDASKGDWKSLAVKLNSELPTE